MKITRRIRLSSLTVALSLVTSFGFTALATAAANPTSAKPKTSASSTENTALTNVIAAGNVKIERRQADLTKLSERINAMKKLSAANKAALTAEVSAAKAGLAELKTSLDASTTVAEAQERSKKIVMDFRVYLLVIPRVHLLKTADGQLAKQTNILNLITMLETEAKKAENSSELLAKLAAAKAKAFEAQALSQNASVKLLALKPSDYNANHKVLKTHHADLKKAHAANVSAYKRAMAVFNTLFKS